MAIFKYTVANKEGKKLNGTVEAPNEETARTELNNLGFSILALTKTDKIETPQSSGPKYVFEAIDKNSKLITGTIPAKDETEAFTKLHSEYSLTVTAIWLDGATLEQINEARKQGAKEVKGKLKEMEQKMAITKEDDLKKKKEAQFVKTKIETVLADVNDLLTTFEADFEEDTKAEIHKKIDKLLRIKNSTNLAYILSTAEDLLKFIRKQEKTLSDKGFQDKRLALEIKTKKLLNELKKTSKPKSLSEDIIDKIEQWEDKHETKESAGTKFLGNILFNIKDFFTTPPEIKVIKNQIKAYNKQLFEFSKLYFKEPTPEYKVKVKASLKTIWLARKKAKHSIKYAKILIKKRKRQQKEDEKLVISFIEEINSFTGWLLAFYIIYYFISVFITTKNFGLSTIPNGFSVYESQIFKYILGILFLLHASTSLKVNFFKKSIVADIALPVVFTFGSILVLLNF